MPYTHWRRLTVLLLIAILSSVTSATALAGLPVIPVTSHTAPLLSSVDTLPSLSEFAGALKSADKSEIRGLYAADLMALRIVQQPLNDRGYVASVEDVATLFRQAALMNTIGLLAHNYFAGKYFSEIEVDDELQVIYGDGSYKTYVVTTIFRFQALDPRNMNSNFIDLQSGATYSAAQLFKQVYMGEHHLTLQTCIQQGQEASWGRLFVIAQPLEAQK
jgi:hypothetical protein